MKNYTKNLLSLFVLASSVLLPVQAVLGTAASSHSLLPPELQLDQSMVDAINQCPGVENGFAQRYSAVVQDKQLLQQEADAITEKKETIAASRVNVDKEEGYLNEFARSQSRMANELEALRKGLHKNHATKPMSAEATIIENEKILAYNKKSGEYNVITDQYNNLVIAQKKRIADHNALVASLNEMVARFNTHSLATQEPTNQLLRDVAKYQGECAVSRQAMSK